MPGPYTIRRNDQMVGFFQVRAENIVRFFDHLGMTTEQKVKFLSEELAEAYMSAEIMAKGIAGLVAAAKRRRSYRQASKKGIL
jgi:hypothetical protein